MGAYLELGVYSWTYGNSVHGPNVIHASSSGSIFQALRTHSISFFHTFNKLLPRERGAYLQIELERGA